jgi:hypothetical protein
MPHIVGMRLLEQGRCNRPDSSKAISGILALMWLWVVTLILILYRDGARKQTAEPLPQSR